MPEIHNAQRWIQGAVPPPLVPKKKNVQQTYIAYDCWANSGLTTSITLDVGNSSLQVSMTVYSPNPSQFCSFAYTAHDLSDSDLSSLNH